MNYYYCAFLLAVLLSIINPVYYKHRKILYFKQHDSYKRVEHWLNAYLIIVFSFLFILIGFRAESVGLDTPGYCRTFEIIKMQGIEARSIEGEMLNAVLMWIVSRLFSSSQAYLIVYSLIICFLFALFIKNNSDNIYLSIIVFLGMFFFPSMNLMRQWLAIGIGINSLTFFRAEKPYRGVLLIFLAVICHTTAFVCFVIPLVERVKNKKRVIIPVIIFSLFIIAFRNRILALLVSYLPRYSGYISSAIFLNTGAFNIKNLIFLFVTLGIAYLILFKKDCFSSAKELNEMYSFLILSILSLTFSICGTTYSMIHRVVYYFSIYYIVSIPKIVHKLKYRFLFYLLVVVSMAVMIWRGSINDNNGISMFEFFWEL